MLNLFGLSASLSENASSAKNIETHEFFGGLTENFSEFNQMISEDAWAFNSDVRLGNEIIIESFTAGVDAEKLEIMQESIFADAVSKVKSFFAKAVAYVKGLIEKIKTFIAGLTKKTDKWYEAMKPRIEKVLANKSAHGKFEYEGHQWNDGELSKLPELANKLADVTISVSVADFKANFGKFGVITKPLKVSMKNVSELIKNVVDAAEGGVAEASKAELTKDENSTNNLDLVKKTNKKAVEEVLKSEIAKIVGTGSTSDVKSALVKKIRGDVRSIKGLGDAQAMLAYVKGCSESLKSIAESYKDLQDQYSEVIKELDSAKLDLDLDSDDPGKMGVVRMVKEGFADGVSTARAIVSGTQQYFNTVTSLQSSLVQDRANEYMKILNRVAQLKA